ncbi:hypothetical protein BaRGS_00012108, partial [Batillaria attramentaria]
MSCCSCVACLPASEAAQQKVTEQFYWSIVALQTTGAIMEKLPTFEYVIKKST